MLYFIRCYEADIDAVRTTVRKDLTPNQITWMTDGGASVYDQSEYMKYLEKELGLDQPMAYRI